jgi:hypothetical protein
MSTSNRCFLRVIQGGGGDIRGLLVAGGGEELHAGLARHGPQLLDGGGAVDVAAHHQDLLLAHLPDHPAQLAGGGGLAGALQAGHEEHGGGLGGEGQGRGVLAHQVGKFPVHHADELLAGGEAGEHLLAHGLFLHPGDEVAHHGQGHVGLQQGHAYLAQGVLDIGFGQAALAAQILDDLG